MQDVSGPDTLIECNLEGSVDTHSAGETPLERTNAVVDNVVIQVGLVRCADARVSVRFKAVTIN